MMLSQSGEGKEKGEEMRKGCDLSPRPSQIPLRGRCGKGASPLMAVVIVHSKATFVSGGISFSPLGDACPSGASGRRERGFPVLHYNPAMPIKNIIPGQTVTKEKLQRDPSVLRTSPRFQKTKMGRVAAT